MYTSRTRLFRHYPSTIRIRASAPFSSTPRALGSLKTKKSSSSFSLKVSNNIFRLRAPLSQTRSVHNFNSNFGENASAVPASLMACSPKVVQKKRASLKLRLNLPKVLPRPAVARNGRWAQMHLNADVPVAYAKDKLAEIGSSMLTAIASTTTAVSSASSSSLPKSIAVEHTDSTIPSGFYPNRLLAVHGPISVSNEGASSSAVTLYPVHDIVISAYCNSLPALTLTSETYSQPQPESSSSTHSLPLQPIRLPSPQTFPLLLHYIYTRSTSSLQHALSLPSFPPSDLSTEPKVFLQQSAQNTFNVIIGTWKNACALGVDDEAFWGALQGAWEGLRREVLA